MDFLRTISVENSYTLDISCQACIYRKTHSFRLHEDDVTLQLLRGHCLRKSLAPLRKPFVAVWCQGSLPKDSCRCCQESFGSDAEQSSKLSNPSCNQRNMGQFFFFPKPDHEFQNSFYSKSLYPSADCCLPQISRTRRN